MAAFPNLAEALKYKPGTWKPGEVNPSSFSGFNYSGNWTPGQGFFQGSDDQGAFYYTPAVRGYNTGGNAGNVSGTWGDGGFVADPQEYYGLYTQPEGANDGKSPYWGAQYGQDAQLVNLTGNTNLPGVGANNLGWGYMSRTAPKTNRNLPYQSTDWTNGVIKAGPWIVASAGLGALAAPALAGAAGAGVAGAEAGALGAGALEAGALTGAAGYGTALEASLAGLGAGTGGLAAGADAAWGANPSWDYGEFLNSIGVDPASTQFSGGTLGNAEIAASIGGGGSALPSWVNDIAKAFNMTNADGSLNMGQLVKLIPNVVGMLGSNAQTNAIGDVAKNQAALQQQAIGMGAPYRAEALKMLNDPNSFFSGQVAQDNLRGVLQGLSVNGNPFGNPTSLALAQQGQRGLYNSTLANLGQMGGLSGYNAAGANQALSTQLALQQAMSQGNSWNALGAGLNTILNPQPSLVELLAMLKGGGGIGGVGLTGNDDGLA
jgi:hypothetical protein